MTEGNLWGCGKLHALDWLFFLGYVPFLKLRLVLKLSIVSVTGQTHLEFSSRAIYVHQWPRYARHDWLVRNVTSGHFMLLIGWEQLRACAITPTGLWSAWLRRHRGESRILARGGPAEWHYKHGFAVPKIPYTQTLSTARPGVPSTPNHQ